ncbi:hypothetical protein [Phenylobacterium sp.]|uniref:hypothetical protein n=1 Tax=Phenylobacterium sp. TaxID=1871053 RepID=UPI003D29F4E0
MSESDDGNLPQTAEPYSPEDWLTASQTLRLVREATMSRSSHIAICTRAHAGLIRAHADLMILGAESRTDHLVHKEFWWARGHEALSQNWHAGDFETWIDKRFHMQAFGVKFHRDDVRRMAPTAFQTSAPPEPQRSGGRPMSRDWPEWVAELVAFVHEEGVPPGEGTRGADALIDAIDARLESRGVSGPSRSTVQETVNLVLRRLRSS